MDDRGRNDDVARGGASDGADARRHEQPRRLAAADTSA